MDRQFDILDALTILGFIIGYKNYEENVDQNTMQDAVQKAGNLINEHLEMQDNKLDLIIEKLGGIDIGKDNRERKGTD